MHTVQSLTQDVLVSLFPEGVRNYSGLTIKGKHYTFAELRKQVLDKQSKKSKTKFQRAENVLEMKKMLEDKIKNGEVFINKSQPNVHINGCKCYIICGAAGRHRLGIMHKDATFDDMQAIAGIEGTPSTSKRHILFSGLLFDDLVDLINLLCGK